MSQIRRVCLCLLLALFVGSHNSNPQAQGDVQPPTVVLRSPAPGATSVSTQVDVAATFSEAIVEASLSFVLRDPNNVVVPGAIAYDGLARTATFNPTADLVGARTYTATVSGARDAAGNVMASPVTWSFTTATVGFQTTTVFSGLDDPTAVEFASDGRVFVAEKSGIIKVFDSLTDTTPTVFANLTTRVYNFWDRGLLGLALHPDFPVVPYVYVLVLARRCGWRGGASLGNTWGQL